MGEFSPVKQKDQTKELQKVKTHYFNNPNKVTYND